MRGRRSRIRLVGPGQSIRDEEGRWRDLGSDVVVDAVVAAASSRDRDARRRPQWGSGLAGAQGATGGEARVDLAVAHVSRSTAVARGWRAVVAEVDDHLDGEYAIDEVQVTRTAYRLVLRREVEAGEVEVG